MSIEIKPFRIGDIQIDFPVVLAALAGFSDLTYRLLCREFGAPYCATEMMLDRLLMVRGKLRTRLFALTPADHPVAGQIIGNDPDTMAQAAMALEEMGFDVVDLNFACPVRKALSRRRGGYMMSQVEGVLKITRAVIEAVDRPVTLKVRRQFDNDDTEDNFWRIAEGAFDAGAAAICVHARTVETKYFGPANWEFLARVKAHFHDKTIIGSGDVLTPQRAMDMLSQTGVDAAAVARGGIGNPWFFRQVRDLAAGREPHKPDLAEQRNILLRHFAEACEFYGSDKGPKFMRGFAVKYARMHPRPKDVRIAFVKVKCPRDWHEVVDNYYPQEAPVGEMQT